MDLSQYTNGREAASLALVGDLTDRLADAESAAVYEDHGFVVLRDGRVIDWRDKLDRPTRRRGNVILADSDSFTAYLDRFGTADTMLYASIADETITAVLNDHPGYTGNAGADDTGAGRRDDIVQLNLRTSDDWGLITRNSGQMLPQRRFAELIEDLAHTVVRPESAVMLEVASTLNVRQNIDFASRVRTQTGDVEFRFEQTSEARAGRDTRIEIPTLITFRAPVWVGSPAVDIEARLRFHGSSDGCVMGYRLMRLGDVTEGAFRDIVADIDRVGAAPSALFGDPMVGIVSRTQR